MRLAIPLLLSASLACAALAQPASAARTDDVRRSVAGALAILQKSQAVFDKQATCASCHSQIAPLVAGLAAREKGVPLDETVLTRQRASIIDTIDSRRESNLSHTVNGGAHAVVGSLMGGVIEAKAPASEGTDAAVILLMGKQLPSGAWSSIGVRFPAGTTDFQLTANAVRAIDAYAPPSMRKEADRRIAGARAWLVANHAPNESDALVNRLQGLVWAKAPGAAIAKARADLVATQRPDGGWAQTPALASDAYATGAALLAFHFAGMKPSDPVYQRGVDFLLRTQAADGSWFVKTRALPLQPPIDSGFPYGRDQWISAWATAYSAEALAYAL